MLDNIYVFKTAIKADDNREAWNSLLESLQLAVEGKEKTDALACIKSLFDIEDPIKKEIKVKKRKNRWKR